MSASAYAVDPKDAAHRRYHDGPLTAEDFQGDPDDSKAWTAWTSTDVLYRYGYRYRNQNKQVIVTLSEIEVFAVLERDKSWTRRPRDPLLLDHEQGHFDLTHIHALQAQQHLRKSLKTADVLTAKATTEKKAIELLEQRLREMVKVFSDKSLEANRQYDKETANGTDASAQALARRDHRAQIEALAAEEKPLPP